MGDGSKWLVLHGWVKLEVGWSELAGCDRIIEMPDCRLKLSDVTKPLPCVYEGPTLHLFGK